MTLSRILGFRLVAADAEGLARFYAALGFAVDEERPIEPAEMTVLGLEGRGWRRPMRLGDARVDLDRFEPAGRPYPAGTDSAARIFQHFALVTSDVVATWPRALAAGATPISRDGPVALPASSGGATAVKFRDPDGHPLELIQFPDMAAKGWRGEGVLGIDHSAIVPADLAASETFYRDHGLARGEATVNRGPEQDALDGLRDALADVVPMMPARPAPHVELLGYRSPAVERFPAWAVNDVVATRFVWEGDAPALLRDPDGHLHQIG